MVPYSRHSAQHVLVVGPPLATGALVGALRARGVSAWSDRLGRAAADGVSLAWADGLVVVDPSEHLECRHVRPFREFPGPAVLAASAPVAAGEVARLLDAGFDAVLPWPVMPDLVAARVAAMLRRPALPRRSARTGA